MSKLILFLDDMEARHEMASSIASHHPVELLHARTAEDAIRILGDYGSRVEAAALDHDLADEHYAGPYASTAQGGTAHSGRAVARWIAEHGNPVKILVHSFNPDGSRAMSEILEAVGLEVTRAPFGPLSFGRWLRGIQ